MGEAWTQWRRLPHLVQPSRWHFREKENQDLDGNISFLSITYSVFFIYFKQKIRWARGQGRPNPWSNSSPEKNQSERKESTIFAFFRKTLAQEQKNSNFHLKTRIFKVYSVIQTNLPTSRWNSICHFVSLDILGWLDHTVLKLYSTTCFSISSNLSAHQTKSSPYYWFALNKGWRGICGYLLCNTDTLNMMRRGFSRTARISSYTTQNMPWVLFSVSRRFSALNIMS